MISTAYYLRTRQKVLSFFVSDVVLVEPLGSNFVLFLGLTYSREAKLLCKKVVAFFQLLAQSQDTGVRRLGVTQELLSLVTGLAHYLKLLIRICLQGSLKLERETGNTKGLDDFLAQINSLDERLEAEANVDYVAESAIYVPRWADTCPVCDIQVEDKCLRKSNRSFQYACMVCQNCGFDMRDKWIDARWSNSTQKVLCKNCATKVADAEGGFMPVSKLRQYVHLLKVAHARLLATLRSSGALPHTSGKFNPKVILHIISCSTFHHLALCPSPFPFIHSPSISQTIQIWPVMTLLRATD